MLPSSAFKVGQKVRIHSVYQRINAEPGPRPGNGTVVAIVPKGECLSMADVMRYYKGATAGPDPGYQIERFRCNPRHDRVIVARDDTPKEPGEVSYVIAICSERAANIIAPREEASLVEERTKASRLDDEIIEVNGKRFTVVPYKSIIQEGDVWEENLGRKLAPVARFVIGIEHLTAKFARLLRPVPEVKTSPVKPERVHIGEVSYDVVQSGDKILKGDVWENTPYRPVAVSHFVVGEAYLPDKSHKFLRPVGPAPGEGYVEIEVGDTIRKGDEWLSRDGRAFALNSSFVGDPLLPYPRSDWVARRKAPTPVQNEGLNTAAAEAPNATKGPPPTGYVWKDETKVYYPGDIIVYPNGTIYGVAVSLFGEVPSLFGEVPSLSGITGARIASKDYNACLWFGTSPRPWTHVQVGETIQNSHRWVERAMTLRVHDEMTVPSIAGASYDGTGMLLKLVEADKPVPKAFSEPFSEGAKLRQENEGLRKEIERLNGELGKAVSVQLAQLSVIEDAAWANVTNGPNIPKDDPRYTCAFEKVRTAVGREITQTKEVERLGKTNASLTDRIKSLEKSHDAVSTANAQLKINLSDLRKEHAEALSAHDELTRLLTDRNHTINTVTNANVRLQKELEAACAARDGAEASIASWRAEATFQNKRADNLSEALRTAVQARMAAAEKAIEEQREKVSILDKELEKARRDKEGWEIGAKTLRNKLDEAGDRIRRAHDALNEPNVGNGTKVHNAYVALKLS